MGNTTELCSDPIQMGQNDSTDTDTGAFTKYIYSVNSLN